MKTKKTEFVKRMESIESCKYDFYDNIRHIRMNEMERDMIMGKFDDVMELAENYSQALEAYEELK